MASAGARRPRRGIRPGPVPVLTVLNGAGAAVAAAARPRHAAAAGALGLGAGFVWGGLCAQLLGGSAGRPRPARHGVPGWPPTLHRSGPPPAGRPPTPPLAPPADGTPPADADRVMGWRVEHARTGQSLGTVVEVRGRLGEVLGGGRGRRGSRAVVSPSCDPSHPPPHQPLEGRAHFSRGACRVACGQSTRSPPLWVWGHRDLPPALCARRPAPSPPGRVHTACNAPVRLAAPRSATPTDRVSAPPPDG